GAEEEHRRIRAEREKRGRAEVHVARIAAEDVPRRRDDDVLEDHVCGEIEVRVHAHQGEDDPGRDHREADDERERDAGHQRPKRPAGRTARAASRMPNDTASDQEGPKKVDIRLSTTPRITAATSVPPMLPMPPSTVIANIRPM